MPRIDKASFETKVVYQKCVDAAGILGATVQKVDQGQFNSNSSHYVDSKHLL